MAADVTSYQDEGLYPGSTWFYRVRAYNAAGDSAYSGIANATTSNTPPTLAAISDTTVTEGTTLIFTNSANASDFVRLITDFENLTTETVAKLPLFRLPRYSGTTKDNLDATPDLAVVTDAYPTSGHGAGQVLRISCAFTNPGNPWLRLTTYNSDTWPNPVIDFTKKLRFDIRADKAVKIAVGCRESSVGSGTPIGANGGTSGAIEWAGVASVSGGASVPTRLVNANTWTTLTFDFPNEPIWNFSGGDGVLSTASGLGGLEHLAIVPAAGVGTYNLYLDNFAVLVPRTLTYSLAPGAPTNAIVDPATGVFSWTPSEAQAPGTNEISIVVTDNNTPPLSATRSFVVKVVGRPDVWVTSANGNSFALNWSAVAGTTYRVQFKTNLEDAVWIDVAPDVYASGVSASITNTFEAPQRFYRVQVLSP